MINPISERRIQPYFIDGELGRLFCIQYRCKQSNGLIIYFPPFAEEMNKARRLAALQARAFVDAGMDVLMIDPYGTGDSAGSLSSASWGSWCSDYVALIRTCLGSGKNLIFWGIRLGALLAAQTASLIDWDIKKLILWQPTITGETAMTQFLRLRVAAEMYKNNKVTTKQLREIAKTESSIEIAGYELNADMINDIDNLSLAAMLGMCPKPLNVDWLEIDSSENILINPRSRQLIEKFKGSVVNINSMVLPGQSFWNSSEITINNKLISLTTNLIT